VTFENDDRVFQAQIYKPLKELDLVVISLESGNYPDHAIPIEFTNTPGREGEPVYVYAYPGGGNVVRRDGILATREGEKQFFNSIKIEKGFSGSPLLHEANGVRSILGIVKQQANAGEPEYALASSVIKEYLPSFFSEERNTPAVTPNFKLLGLVVFTYYEETGTKKADIVQSILSPHLIVERKIFSQIPSDKVNKIQYPPYLEERARIIHNMLKDRIPALTLSLDEENQKTISIWLK
jgi:hypothetical protein